MKLFQPISISLSPNTEKDDVWLAFKLIWQPWRWKGNPSASSGQVADLENEFRQYLGVKYAVSFNSGRTSLMAILNALNLEKDSEILLQAFTCNAMPNPVLWSNLKPVFVDCNDNFNINVEDLKRKIALRRGSGQAPKALIVQHTFGIPADMNEILEVCWQNNLILIEDCAHSLGATYKGRKIGTFGHISFFSFSRDKVISSVYGGMTATNDSELAKKLKEYQKKNGYPSYYWIFQQLLHPVLMNWLILPTYRFCGAYFLLLFQKLHFLSKAVHWKEKRGLKPDYFPKRLPNALAILALNQFKKLEKFNKYRRKIAEFYSRELKNTKYKIQDTRYTDGGIFLRFPILHENAHKIIKKAWRKNFLIGDWYTTPIAPHDTKAEKLGYVAGSCKNAEKLAKITLNLPTHINISEKEAKIIIDFLKQNGD